MPFERYLVFPVLGGLVGHGFLVVLDAGSQTAHFVDDTHRGVGHRELPVVADFEMGVDVILNSYDIVMGATQRLDSIILKPAI
mgnify:CR=1 FL=1